MLNKMWERMKVSKLEGSSKVESKRNERRK